VGQRGVSVLLHALVDGDGDNRLGHVGVPLLAEVIRGRLGIPKKRGVGELGRLRTQSLASTRSG
jgi:hypothetical protein